MNRSGSLYRLTMDQKNLLLCESKNNKNKIKDYIEKIIFNHIVVEKGKYKNKTDILIKNDLYRNQVDYILSSDSRKSNDKINKYSIANYYYLLAKRFNDIAFSKRITRNELWKLVKINCIFKDQNETNLRIYKYIFRGEVIPSIKFVKKQIDKYDDLPCYMSIIYLDEVIVPELKESYEVLTGTL